MFSLYLEKFYAYCTHVHLALGPWNTLSRRSFVRYEIAAYTDLHVQITQPLKSRLHFNGMHKSKYVQIAYDEEFMRKHILSPSSIGTIVSIIILYIFADINHDS